jgi:hypothetical protein
MASIIARRAFTSTRAFSTTARRLATGEEALKTESKKNPEILVRQISRSHPSLHRHPPDMRRTAPQMRPTQQSNTWDICH